MSTGHQRITWRRNIAENFNRLSRVHERYRQTDDRQTTDRHEFTFAKNRYIFSNTLWFNPPTEGFPWDDLPKILPGCRQVTNVLRGAETLPKISIG